MTPVSVIKEDAANNKTIYIVMKNIIPRICTELSMNPNTEMHISRI
jgi:hypothetical protein